MQKHVTVVTVVIKLYLIVIYTLPDLESKNLRLIFIKQLYPKNEKVNFQFTCCIVQQIWATANPTNRENKTLNCGLFINYVILEVE